MFIATAHRELQTISDLTDLRQFYKQDLSRNIFIQFSHI